ncbi:MAG: thiol-disulfide oxidoreductase DCC family protein [Myxococcota bacterium]
MGAPAEPIVLYDGECGLCSRSVRWLLRHERDHELRFAPLQGPTASALRAVHPNIPLALESVVYIAGGKAYLRSKALLHAARHLRAPWRWGHVLRWLPAFLLDLPYRLLARLRHRIWGTTDRCELPAPEQRARFLP